MTLEARDLSIGHRSDPLRSGLSFRLEPSSCIAIRGRSGSGKSTLLRTLAFLIDPLAGRLTLDGRSPTDLGVPRYRRRVVYVPQRPVFFGGTVADELARPFGYRVADTHFDEGRARASLAGVDLPDVWSKPAAELSEGQAQRLSLVRAALLAPSVLLLDEPTSALDPESAARVEAYLRELGAGLVLVSHDAAQRERLASTTLDLGAARA